MFEGMVRPGFADCAPSGRARLDALARWLQDIAYADVVDAELADRAVWVVRRTRVRVQRFPRVGEACAVSTFCSGVGRMWAERRTSISLFGAPESEVEAVTLWVHLDPTSWRPIPLGDDEASVYGPSTGGRRVTARLRHPVPSWDEPSFTWTFRATELDIAGHINNAAYWQPLEEQLLLGGEIERIDAELEYRTPAQPGEKRVLHHGDRRWIVGTDQEIHASFLLAEVVAADREVAGARTDSASPDAEPARGQASD